MKNFNFTHIFFLVSVICMVSCSTNGFFAKKNHQPRVRIEAQVQVEPEKEPQEIPGVEPSVEHPDDISSSCKPDAAGIKETQPHFFEKVLVAFYPDQQHTIKKVFHHPEHTLRPSRLDEGDDRTTGLIINLLALAFGIAAILMVIGVAHGNLWVYFVVGLVLAAAAIIMGMIGKGMPWRGVGWLAGVIGIVAVVLLIIFMVLVAVVKITF